MNGKRRRACSLAIAFQSTCLREAAGVRVRGFERDGRAGGEDNRPLAGEAGVGGDGASSGEEGSPRGSGTPGSSLGRKDHDRQEQRLATRKPARPAGDWLLARKEREAPRSMPPFRRKSRDADMLWSSKTPGSIQDFMPFSQPMLKRALCLTSDWVGSAVVSYHRFAGTRRPDMSGP